MAIALPASSRRVLADVVRRPASRVGALAVDATLVMVGTLLVAVAAQITIPLPIVPITGQTLAVLIVGASLGAVRGGSALALYGVVGMLGVPVFADGERGAQIVFGSTGGFIVGFIASAFLVGALAERAWDRKIVQAFVVFLAGTGVTFVVGLPWLYVWFEIMGAANYTEWGYASALDGTIQSGLLPFIVPGVIKALLAALIVPAAWLAVRAVDRNAKR